MNRVTCAKAALVAYSIFGLVERGARAQNTPRFVPEEATIASLHAALESGQATCVQVTRAYLERIDAYDHKGPSRGSRSTAFPSS